MLNKDMVRLLRLTSGEELLGEVDYSSFEKGGDVTMKNPHIVVPQDAGGGQIRIGMAPWIFYFKGEDHMVTIRGGSIIFMITPPDQLIEQLEKLTSKLALPPSGIQLAR